MDSLKWDAHVSDVTERAQRRFFIIHKLMSNGFHCEFLIDVYCKEIRSILEYGSVLFHSGLTQELSNRLEDIQKVFLRLLSKYIGVKFSYMESCIYFCIEPLSLRHQTLSETFLKKVVKDDRHNLLTARNNDRELVSHRKYQEYQSYSSRHFFSPLVSLTRLSNQMKL